MSISLNINVPAKYLFQNTRYNSEKNNIGKCNLDIILSDTANNLGGVTLAIRCFAIYSLMWPFIVWFVAELQIQNEIGISANFRMGIKEVVRITLQL